MEDEIKRAYETLGLPENASKADVEKRYEMLLRQARARQMRKETEEADDDFSSINRAYRLITEREDRKIVSALQQEQYGKYKRFAGPAERLDHFIRYYKWHVIGAIAAVLLVLYGISAYMDQRAEQARLAALPPADLTGTFIGRFYLPEGTGDTAKIEEAVLGQMPEWRRVEFDLLSLNLEAQSQIDIAMQQKVIVQLATEKPDVYVLDRATFDWFVRNGVLLNLDAAAEGRLKGLLTEQTAVKGAANDDTGEKVYGIDVSGSAYAEALPLIKESMVVGIRADSKQADNALLLIERYLRQTAGNKD
ncbi:MAG TPA: DnaJ domain-containing protein [Paenibacillus sp.]|uniref:DnaJ domain-containing protein n=1 Tax=Paenibacillus sp. TaxID=58172 RepID=UPI0028D2FFD8|nr:DnaJ domain-containing protein [Paenibacillus sp.]HUC92105.1 DnaJ domain-containing protein [Paenibacillus sp.]